MIIGRFFRFMDIIKSIDVNYRLFGLKGVCTLPIKVRRGIKIGTLERNSVEVSNNCKRFMIKMGYNGSPFVDYRREYLSILGGKIKFDGSCTIAEGFSIFVNGGTLQFGDGIFINRNVLIQCEDEIKIGKDVLIGWNINIRDTDGHQIKKNGELSDEKKPIFIDNSTWIASDCTILKGTRISKNCVVGCNSLLCGQQFEEEKSLIVGSPAKKIRGEIEWKN